MVELLETQRPWSAAETCVALRIPNTGCTSMKPPSERADPSTKLTASQSGNHWSYGAFSLSLSLALYLTLSHSLSLYSLLFLFSHFSRCLIFILFLLLYWTHWDVGDGLSSPSGTAGDNTACQTTAHTHTYADIHVTSSCFGKISARQN